MPEYKSVIKGMGVIDSWKFGSKELFANIDHSNNARTFVITRDIRERVENETTYLYQKAYEFLQQQAEERQTSIKYFFSSESEKMMAWADHPEKGRTIFDWEQFAIEDGKLLAQATVFPGIHQKSNR